MSKRLIDEATVKLVLDEMRRLARLANVDHTENKGVAALEQVITLAEQPAPVHQECKSLDLAAAIEYADARWAGVDVPIEWCRHFADALQPEQRKPLTKGEWPKHPSPYVNDEYRGYLKSDLDDYAMQVLAAHNIKENA